MAKKAPKKYLDARQIEVNPDWVLWDDERRADASGDGALEALSAGFDPAVYFPENDDKAIPDEGAWILILEEPHTALKEHFTVPLVSMWRARRHTLSNSSFTTRSGVKVFPQQAVIATPAGDLHFWPHEYVIATNPMGLASDPDAELHALGGQPVLDEEEMFYLQSRGIDRQTATMMLFDKIESFNFVYVTFPEWVTEALAGVGQSLRRHIALNPRTTIPS